VNEVYTRYFFPHWLRLELRADWSDPTSPIQQRWSRPGPDLKWVPDADWNHTGFTVGQCETPARAMEKIIEQEKYEP